VEGALEARERLSISSEGDVRSVHIRTFEQAVFAMAGHPTRWRPETRETADHSIPFVVACALKFGAVEPKHFEDDVIRSPELVTLMQKITVVEDPECQGAWPDATLSIVEVEAADGRRHSARIPYHLGHSKRPVGDGDIEAKFRGLARGLLDDQQQSAALSALWGIDGSSNLRDVMDLLAVAGQRGS
jgi:2-methylcitrate dehydratase